MCLYDVRNTLLQRALPRTKQRNFPVSTHMFRHGSLTLSPQRVYSDIIAINRNVSRERYYTVDGRYVVFMFIIEN